MNTSELRQIFGEMRCTMHVDDSTNGGTTGGLYSGLGILFHYGEEQF